LVLGKKGSEGFESSGETPSYSSRSTSEKAGCYDA